MAYGIQNLMQASRAPRRDVQRLSQMGRGGDDTVGHLTSGEMVVPKELQTPGIMSLIAGKMRQHGLNPAQYIVGSSHAQANANPVTGAQQFKYGGDTNEGGASGFDRDDSSRDGGGEYGPGGYHSVGGRTPYGEQTYSPEPGSISAWDSVDTDDYFSDVNESIARVDQWADQRDNKSTLAKVLGGILGFGFLGPMGAKLGWKGAGNLANSMWGGTPTVADYNRDLAKSTWGGDSAGPGDGGRDGRGGYMTNPSEGIRPVAPVDGVGGTPATTNPVTPASAPDYENIDWSKYGESGGEILMYPWQTATGISYGQYPSTAWGPIAGTGDNNPNNPWDGAPASIKDILDKYLVGLGRTGQ